MAWHPQLVVRWGKGGGISSPTTHLGYGLLGCLGAVFLGAIVAAALHGKPIMLLGAFIPAFLLRDAWAWFGATPREREAFLAEIARLTHAGKGKLPGQIVIEGSSLALVMALAGVAVSLVLLKVFGEPLFLLLAMIAASLAGVMVLDVIRRRAARRRASKP